MIILLRAYLLSSGSNLTFRSRESWKAWWSCEPWETLLTLGAVTENMILPIGAHFLIKILRCLLVSWKTVCKDLRGQLVIYRLQ